jgi:mRNA interferase YafQ
MRRIEHTNAFRRDFKREKRGQHRRDVEALLALVISSLADDKALAERNRDHALAGEWHDFRECHLKPDLAAHLPKTRSRRSAIGSHGVAHRTL